MQREIFFSFHKFTTHPLIFLPMRNLGLASSSVTKTTIINTSIYLYFIASTLTFTISVFALGPVHINHQTYLITPILQFLSPDSVHQCSLIHIQQLSTSASFPCQFYSLPYHLLIPSPHHSFKENTQDPSFCLKLFTHYPPSVRTCPALLLKHSLSTLQLYTHLILQ